MSPTAVDPLFKTAGRTRGLQIWRVHNFSVEDVAKEHYGTFYSGDSYIILNTKGDGVYDVHFWLGAETSIDERGTAAIKTVELDDSLGGLPVQYREIQDHESALFNSYFKSGVRYLQGGHASGFNKVQPSEQQPRLYHCKGKRNVRCTQVDLKKESLNLGDVFILDLGKHIYVWMPPESGRLERIKGVQQAENIRDQERSGRAKVHVLDHDWDKNTTWWNLFGGVQNVGWIKAPHGGGRDEDYWLEKSDNITLYRCSDAQGKLKIDRIGSGLLKASQLDTNDAFILDVGASGIYVWVGKGCTQNERSKAAEWAREYLEKEGRPKWTQVVRVLESAEPAAFTQWFSDWSEAKKPVQYQPQLYQVSNKSGKLKVDEFVDFYQEDLDGDDVMILDAIHTIYVWVGAGAEREEKDHAKTTAEAYLKSSTVSRHRKASIEVIFQGQEPPTFKKFFPSWDEKFFSGTPRNYKNLRNLIFD